MAKLRNLRAYVPGADNTVGGATSAYDTSAEGNSNAILRKINLNVDIATQNELNDAFTTLSNAITATGTEWKEADVALSNALKEWAKGDQLSGALHTEITAEATARAEADQAIRDSLSAYALSTTVADAYKVAVSNAADQTSSYVYTVTQGGESVGTIEVAKDIFVESAYFDGTILVLDLRNGDTISTDLSGFVDVYHGSDDSEVVTTVEDNVISVRLTEEIARVGANTDLSSADTVYGAKAFAKDYADSVSAAVAVEAEGDAIVSASANGKKVTVGATTDLSTVVAKVQLCAEAWDAAEQNAKDYADELCAAVSATANAEIAAALTSAKDYTDDVSSALSTTAAADIAATKTALISGDGITSADNTIAGAKAYADALVADKNVDAEGDGLVNATAADNKVTVQATNALCAVVSKVEGTSATWDAALQTVSGSTGSYVTITATDKANNNQVIGATVTTHDLSNAVAGTADGLAVASDAKKYVDDAVAGVDNAFVKGVQTQTTAYIEINGDVSLTGNKIVEVNLKESTQQAIDAVASKADLTALTAETTARENADSALSTAIDNLSGAYVDKTTYDDAADALDTFSTGAVSALNDYQDIDDIIKDLIALKAAVATFAAATKNA